MTAAQATGGPAGVSGVGPVGGGVRRLVAPNPGPLTLEGTNSWLVGEREAVLIDPGPDLPGQLERLLELAGGRRVGRICLTHAHADHSGIAGRAAAALGARILASAATLERAGLDGQALADDDRVPVDGVEGALVALETPGHTADGLTFLRPEDGTLFTGDTVLGRGTAVILHPDGEVGPYLASLARLLSLRPRRILPGHGEPVEEAARLLTEYRAHRLERERQVEEAVRGGASSVRDVRLRVYGAIDPRLERAAEASVRAHIAHLAACGVELPPVAGMEPAGPPADAEEECGPDDRTGG